MSKYLDKQALLKWLEQRYRENHEEFEVDRSRENMKIINEIKSGTFDADEPDDYESMVLLDPHNQIHRLRAALEDIRYQIQQSDHPAGLGILATINQALSTPTEQTGAERAKAAIADRYKNALRGWHNPVDRAAGSYYKGYLNGVVDTLRLLGITIPGINATEGDGNDA